MALQNKIASFSHKELIRFWSGIVPLFYFLNLLIVFFQKRSYELRYKKEVFGPHKEGDRNVLNEVFRLKRAGGGGGDISNVFRLKRGRGGQSGGSSNREPRARTHNKPVDFSAAFRLKKSRNAANVKNPRYAIDFHNY